MNRPETLEEWQAYISTQKGPELTSKLRAMATQTFIDMMLEEGHDIAYAKSIVTMMAVQQIATGGKLPDLGVWGLDSLIREKYPDGVGTMSDQQIAALVPAAEPPDQIDKFLDEGDLENEWGQTEPVAPVPEWGGPETDEWGEVDVGF